MHKGIRLAVEFNAPQGETVFPEVLSAGLWRHPTLKVELKRVRPGETAGWIAKLRVEGEAEPAYPWAKFTIQAMQEILAAGQWRRPNVLLETVKVEEDRNWEEEEDTL